jgi:hypothetical protein
MSVPRPLSRIVPKVAGKALGKKGMAFGTLITDWATIMGPELARSTLPQKLAFPPGLKEGATLHLKVSGSAALDVQHAEPQLIERINAFFGYRAVSRIRIIQGPIPGAPRRPKVQRPMTPEEEAGIQLVTSPIEDDDLRESLARNPTLSSVQSLPNRVGTPYTH